MVQKRGEELVTKSFLRVELNTFGKRLKEEIINEVANMKDEIIKEVRELREEFDAHQFSHRRINDDLAEHNERLRKLEPITSTG